MSKKLVRELRNAKKEKVVENSYWDDIKRTYKTEISNPFNTDGYFKIGNIAVLCEFKYDKNLKDSYDFRSILAQVIFYLKKFADCSFQYDFPNTVIFGDEDECSAISTELLKPYLSKEYDWSIAPSEAYSKCTELMEDLLNDPNLQYTPIFDITDDFEIKKTVGAYLVRSGSEVKANISITKDNLVDAYNYWITNVIQDDKVNNEQNVEIFMKVILNPETVQVLEKGKKCELLIIRKNDDSIFGNVISVKIDKRMYESFFSIWKLQHTIKENTEISAYKCILDVEKYRRRTGEFYTPKVWVDESHKMITEELGENWRDEYIVWDCSCGTANLTRGYKFKELYLSTLEQSDVDIITINGFNPGAIVFQFDFLNDSLDKLPKGLRKALEENKKIVFFNNPPYGTSTEYKYKINKTLRKEKIPENLIYNQMKVDGLSESSNDLVSQFIYRLSNINKHYCLNDSRLFLFTKQNLFDIPTYNKLRKSHIFQIFNPIAGFLFNSENFEGILAEWGVLFSMFEIKQGIWE